MRALVLLLILALSALGLRADEASEEVTTDDQAQSRAAEAPPPVAPVETRGGDDSFLPTDRLRHDQEVDYPTDI
ncbi:MAG: hypothetical protein JJT88_11975 [Gammaproteobacteria bacterium]|nr:hypothetical protein [Gammaproteobacteria bacterium]